MRFFIARFGDIEKQHAHKKHPMDSMNFVFLTDLERIEALHQFRICCSYPRFRNIFLLHSCKKG